MDCNQRMKKDPQHQASTDNKEKQPLMSQEEDSIEKVLPEGHTEEHLTTLHLPSTDVTQLQRMKLYKPQQQRGSTQTPHRLPSPGMNLPTWTKKKVAKKKTVLGMPLPQRAITKTTQQLHTALSNQLDKALQEALDKPGPSCLRKQGGGDREPTPGPQVLKQGELNLATEKWFLEPNKVRFMDEPDTYRANVGRHREPQPRLMKAKTYPHLVFADPPASPDRETSKSPRERRAASNPPGEVSKATPDSTTIQKEPSLEMHEAPPVPLEPEVEVIPHPGAPFPQKDDSDCEIVEPPMPFKPKKGWAKKRMEQTKKTLVLCIPRMDGSSSKERGSWSLSDGEPCPTGRRK